MAAELCRVSLWLEAIEPGKPLSFLDHHIRVGNSLLGATPALLAKGIPDEAFTPIEGDDKEICSRFKKVNKTEKIGYRRLFAATTEPWDRLGDLAASMVRLDNAPDDSIEAVRNKERMYEAMVRSGKYLDGQFWADTWCAAFVWKKTQEFNHPITEEDFRRIEHNPHACDAWMRDEIVRLSQQYQFFHWHLAFPDVFHVPAVNQTPENEQTGWSGGFDVMLGNPPWDKIQPEEVKFFGGIRPDIADAASASTRKAMITGLANEDPALAETWLAYKREIDATCHLLRDGKVLPLTTDGNLNTYRLFAEMSYNLLASNAYSGMIVQTGMATDESGKEFFGEVLLRGRLVRFLDFENKGNFFPDVHAQFRFALLTTCGVQLGHQNRAGEFGWLLHSLEEVHEPERLVHLTSEDIALFNPASGTCPVFQCERDLTLNRKIYSHGVHISLDSEHRFGEIEFLGELFNMTRDSGLFISQPGCEDRCLPLYEAKFIYHFDHRYAEYSGGDYRETPVESKTVPAHSLIPKSWVPIAEVERRTRRRRMSNSWLIGFRDVASSTNERTAIMAIFPFAGVGNNINLLLALTPEQAALLCANVDSFVFDYACRQKTSGMHVNLFTMRQLPAIPLSSYECLFVGCGMAPREFVVPRVLELSYTAWDLKQFAADLGFNAPPFFWDTERRFLLRCELDALYFHLYGLARDDAAYIMDTFPIVKRKDEEKYGEYRTKHVILEIYNSMAEATRTGIPYQTRLSPPPADAAVAHPWPEEIIQVAAVSANRLSDIAALPDEAWAMPVGVTPENVALFSLIDILQTIGEAVDPERIRLAAILVRKPMLAAAFMDDAQAKQWLRLIGQEARPVRGNVVQISQFQKNGVDYPWAEAIRQLRGSGALVVGSDGKWSAGDKMPASSSQDWITGRAAIAVQLLSAIDPARVEQKLIAFNRSVEDGTARRAVS
jgi:hypothetical protein